MSMLKDQNLKVRDHFASKLAEVMYYAADRATLKHKDAPPQANLEEDMCVRDCASEFYELAEEVFLLDRYAADLEKSERFGDFAEVLTELRECTKLIPTYENNCHRFVALGWIPPSADVVRAAMIKKAQAIIGRKGSSFETLFVDNVSVPEELYDDDEEEEEDEDEEEGEEVEADSAEEGDEEMEADSAEEGDEEEALPDSAEEDDDEEEEEEEEAPPPPPKKKKKAA